ncbi:hypothetical protein D6C89_06920 [Aureobasidium pullulans]|nr:hypothetical protein D6D04_06883 [Aureobasidium pullulans]THZ20934.1 hypothetical protein D6C89_06920 [Aureobasidium pullulans]
MSSPASFAMDMDASQTPGNPFLDIPTRPMRVKVLYTFDNDNKTNCLARFPDILHVPTVPIDENTQIGVIELRTCIRAIVSASPELVSRLTQGDFTIYAYDYSEYETPLVGQGMLSSVLAAASPTPTAPAYQSKTMITGRVCKNIMGLFSNGVKETLEVKLRLVPVPKPVQGDFIKSMEIYRNLNPAMSAGFDPNAWSASFSQSGLSLGAPFEEGHTPTQMRQDMPDHDMMSFQRPRQGSNASFHGQPSFSGPTPSYSGPPSRVNSPAMNQSGPQTYPAENIARPSSRMSMQSEMHHERRGSMAGSEQYQEEGPARKRVKVTQADWRGKSTFGGPSDSLRVTASTAASIRVHKPVAMRPGMMGNSLEPPPRVPTPVPQINLPGSRPNAGSILRRESSLARTQTYNSPYDPTPSCLPPPSDSAMSSPEDAVTDHIGITPTEFPSSPPLLPEPSSPGLPSFSRPADSGYMSSAFECHDDDEDRSVCEEDMQIAAQYRPRTQAPPSGLSFIEQTPGPPELLPTRMQMSNNGKMDDAAAAAQAELSRKKARNAVLAQNSRRNSVALPPKPQLQSNKPSMARSASMIVRSDAASPAPTDLKAPRSGSGAQRKKNIQDKLQKSIENGEMPPFCGHCGAIETPTWRHLFVKTVVGSPDDMDLESENVTIGIEVLDRNPDTQRSIKYRIIKSMRKTKDSQEQTIGFDTMQVCNRKSSGSTVYDQPLTKVACGLWFNKFKVMRPADKWVKKQAVSRKKQQRKAMPPAGPSEPQSDYFVDQPSALYTDAVQPEDDNDNDNDNDSRSSEERTSEETAPPANRPRASSMQPQPKHDENEKQWTGPELDAALHRAIQSSPARFVGSQESPIEVEAELTPRPTRRLLFPSPRERNGQMKTLDDLALPGAKPQSSTIIEMAFVEEPNKENCPPRDEDDDLAHLFECSPNVFKTPRKTPEKNAIHHQDTLLKTPTPSRSSLRTVARNTRTPSGNQGSTFLPTFSSAEAKNLFPTTPSRWANLSSPSRNQMTPFTRQLTQLLSDAHHEAPFLSPGRQFEFSDAMPTFMTPGRSLDFNFDDFDMMNVDISAGVTSNPNGNNSLANTAITDATSALHATTTDAPVEHNTTTTTT